MTDRYAGFIVALEQDLREDDAQETIKAILMIKGVLKVEPQVSTPEISFARARMQVAVTSRLNNLMRELMREINGWDAK